MAIMAQSVKTSKADTITRTPVTESACQPPAAPTWLPIDCAPKDGTLVLGYIPDNPGQIGGALFMRFDAADGEWREENSTQTESWPVDCEPTHWMTIPDFPETDN